MSGVDGWKPVAISKSRAAVILLAAVVVSAALLPFDAVISRYVSAIRPGGDLRRELEMIQQFGSATTMILVALLVWRLDPSKLRRMLDWLVAAAITWAAVFVLKSMLGRPRPKFEGEHLVFLGPWSARVVKEGDPPRHAWEFWHDQLAGIWSMPSSHTAFAVLAAVMLSSMYPRLRAVVWTLAIIVGICRVLFRAHYPSDVVIGGTIGYVVGTLWIGRGASTANPA